MVMAWNNLALMTFLSRTQTLVPSDNYWKTSSKPRKCRSDRSTWLNLSNSILDWLPRTGIVMTTCLACVKISSWITNKVVPTVAPQELYNKGLHGATVAIVDRLNTLIIFSHAGGAALQLSRFNTHWLVSGYVVERWLPLDEHKLSDRVGKVK